jgi:hypothetical protein
MRSWTAVNGMNQASAGGRRVVWLRGAAPGRHLCVLVRGMLLLTLLVTVPAAVSGTVPDWLGVGADHPAALVAASVMYALVLAVPFVPSVEIGLLIMVVFGKWGALAAYLATLLGLNLGFATGRFLAPRWSAGPPGLPERLNAVAERVRGHLPAGAMPALALAALLNVPGNTALGGGGGIAMFFGATRILSWPAFALTAGLTTAMVPLLFLLGVIGVENLRVG